MRKLTVLLTLLALAAIVTPASAQFVGTGMTFYDDNSDADATDNRIRIGSSGKTGAAVYLGGTQGEMAGGGNFEIGQGAVDAVYLVINPGWGSFIMVDGDLDITNSTVNRAYYIGRDTGTGYLTQIGGTLAIGQLNREVMFGACGTSGGFPKATSGQGTAYVELKGGTMILRGSPRVGAYNCWVTPDALGANPVDPSGANTGRFMMTGGTLDVSSAVDGQNFFIGFTGGDGEVEILGESVAKFNQLLVGNADERIYTVGSAMGTIRRETNAVLKIGKDAMVTAENAFFMYDNQNAELQIQIASLTDFSSIAVTTGSCVIGQTWGPEVPADTSSKLYIELLEGYNPQMGDEWVIVTAAGGVTADPWASITSSAALDAGLYWDGRVDDGNKLVVFVAPEPATMALLALGGLALIRRRR